MCITSDVFESYRVTEECQVGLSDLGQSRENEAEESLSGEPRNIFDQSQRA